MPVVNPLARELVFKIVYYGPGLGGKTTTLQHIHAATKPEHRGKMVSLATPVDRTLYFDFLPIRVPNVRGMGVRLQLFTVPGQVYYNATRKLVLTGADGIVMVYDSQRARIDSNVESLDNLQDNLREHGRALGEVPHVIQYNKRDLADILPIAELEPKLNKHRTPAFATVATRGDGIFETLEAITRAVLDDFDRRMPAAHGSSPHELELPEGGLAEALRRAEGPEPSPSTTLVARAKAPAQRPSGALRLSSLPDVDPGEDAARVVTGDERAPSKPPPLPADLLDSQPSTSKAGDGAGPAPAASGSPPEARRPQTIPAGSPPEGRRPQSGPSGEDAEPPENGWRTSVRAAPLEPTPSPEAQLTPSANGGGRSESLAAAATQAQERSPAPGAAEPSRDVTAGADATFDAPVAARRSPTALPPTGFAPPAHRLSFEVLWPVADRGAVRELEAALAGGNYHHALSTADELVIRALASAARVLGATADAPRDPAVVALLLGIDGPRYLEFRGLVRDARAGRPISHTDALGAYAFVVELRLARAKFHL